MPDTSDPQPAESEESHEIQDPTPLPDEEYHMRADGFLEQVVNKMEELQEGREDIDVEFAVCPFFTRSHGRARTARGTVRSYTSNKN